MTYAKTPCATQKSIQERSSWGIKGMMLTYQERFFTIFFFFFLAFLSQAELTATKTLLNLIFCSFVKFAFFQRRAIIKSRQVPGRRKGSKMSCSQSDSRRRSKQAGTWRQQASYSSMCVGWLVGAPSVALPWDEEPCRLSSLRYPWRWRIFSASASLTLGILPSPFFTMFFIVRRRPKSFPNGLFLRSLSHIYRLPLRLGFLPDMI